MSEIENMGEVDTDPRVHIATEADEEEVLERLFGPPDRDGVFRGDPATPFREAAPGEPLPEVDPSTYGPGSVPLPEEGAGE